jgi:hypothetical protein
MRNGIGLLGVLLTLFWAPSGLEACNIRRSTGPIFVAFSNNGCSGNVGEEKCCDGGCIGITNRNSFDLKDTTYQLRYQVALYTGKGCSGTSVTAQVGLGCSTIQQGRGAESVRCYAPSQDKKRGIAQFPETPEISYQDGKWYNGTEEMPVNRELWVDLTQEEGAVSSTLE